MSNNFVEVLRDIVSSVFGTAACVYTGQPFDTIKVRLQCVPSDAQGGALKCFVNTIQNEGVVALWRGSIPAFTGQLGENMMAFGVNGFLNRIFKQHGISDDSMARNYISGSVTGLCTAFILCPADVIKCRAQLNRFSGGNGNVREIISKILDTKGLRGLYTGFGCQIARDIPFYCFFFGSYNFSCKLIRSNFPGTPDSVVYFTSGGIAGQVAWAASLPFDTIKSIVQTQTEDIPVRAVIRNIIDRVGYHGLYNGLGVVLIRAFPANAALFLGYEVARNILRM